jgi:hypothetical protein
MLQLQAIRELLKGTFLEDAIMIELEIPRTTDVAIAIAVESENKIEAWKLLKSHLPQTKRYPVVTTCWSSDFPTWEQSIIDNDLCSRFYFDEEYSEQLSPEAIIAKTDLYEQSELAQFLDSKAQAYTYSLEEELNAIIENIQVDFGVVPSSSEMRELKEFRTIIDIERYLFNWEHIHNLTPTLHLGYQDWFEPKDQDLALVLLPNSDSWNALVYLSWYGGSKHAIPLIRQWHRDPRIAPQQQ